ncbi:MAG: hypothetical protein L0332_22280 [Chloroflexi bacterium]|nr:hypothetical protein [Chloroflexota bacterium]MCI0578993.1 hypothetical protein [Chloroflexota bacterium]MCI0648987.1 hypothetical protein [Chloroflexota bacterium]MCI0729422.1 hypothetical protein [Chloroflexota bacterium]
MRKSTAEFLLVRWVDAQVAQGIPRQIIYDRLFHENRAALSLEEKHACSAVADTVLGIMVDRNLQGEELEKDGRVGEAMTLYEENVADQTTAPFPYDRLRVLYTRRGDYHEAIRICQTYLAVLDISDRFNANERRTTWQSHLDELHQKAGVTK